MRAKFKCQTVTEFEGGNEAVDLYAVHGAGSEENKSFASATPGGNLKMTISNPDAYGFFKPGHCYYLDITQAD